MDEILSNKRHPSWSSKLSSLPAAFIQRAPVRENLTFACKMYMPSMSRAECDQRVEEVLSSLGLGNCQHTKVGCLVWHVSLLRGCNPNLLPSEIEPDIKLQGGGRAGLINNN